MADEAANLLRRIYAAPLRFKSHWRAMPDGRMHYLDAGPRNADETLLFVHGNPTWCFHWRRLISRFRKSYRCVAMDHLGMGISEIPVRRQRLNRHTQNVARLVKQLDLQNITLVAQDWGGAIGLGALLRDRPRYRRIVLFNTGAFPPPRIPRRIAVCRTPVLGRVAVQGASAFSRAALSMTLNRRRQLSPEVAAGYLAPYDSWQRRAGVYNFVADIPTSPKHRTWQVLQRLEDRLPQLADLPTCLIWGMRDWCFTPECLERFEQAWPEARVHRLADVGHWVLEDAPTEAAELMQQFLGDTRAPADGS